MARSTVLILLGPVVRINPDEVHINEPDYFDEVFNQTNGRADKPIQVAEAFGPYPAVCFCSSQCFQRPHTDIEPGHWHTNA